MSMSPMSNPVALREHLCRQVLNGRTIQQLVPYILHLPLGHVRNFIQEHIGELDAQELQQYGWKVVSVLEILPPDIVRHALSFVADCQREITSPDNTKLRKVNRTFTTLFREAFYQQRVRYHKFIGDLTTVAQDRIQYAEFLIQDYRFEEARKQYELCTSQSPQFVKGWKDHAAYIRTWGGNEGELQAIQILQEGLAHHQDNPDLHEEISTMYCNIGKFSDAVYHCRELLKTRPGRADVVLKMARIQSQNPTDAESIQSATLMFEQAFQNQTVKFLPQDFLSFSDHLIHNCDRVVRAVYVLQSAIMRFQKDPDREGNVHYGKLNLLTGQLEPRVAMEPEAARLLLQTALILRDPALRNKDDSGNLQFRGDPLADAVVNLQKCIDIHESADCAMCMERMQCEVHAEAFRNLAGVLTFDMRESRFYLHSLGYFVRAMELAPSEDLRQVILHDYREYIQLLGEVGQQLENEAELWLLTHCEKDDVVNFEDCAEDDQKINDAKTTPKAKGDDVDEITVAADVGLVSDDVTISFVEQEEFVKRGSDIVVESFDDHGDIYD